MQFFANLPKCVVRQALIQLRESLPRPSNDTPEERNERDDAAMHAVVALEPADAFEIRLAVEIVVSDAYALVCFGRAEQPGIDADDKRRAEARASSLQNHVRSAMLILERRHRKREKDEAAMVLKAMECAGYWFKDVSVPEREPASEATLPDPANRTFEQMDPAEQYAVLYPDRAAQIRSHRGLPPNRAFSPPEAELIELILASDSPILRELDHPMCAAAE
jgi:hypothetical protein